VLNDLPVTAVSDGILAELGSFYSDETRKLILTFDVPALAALGLTQIAELEFTYVELPALTQHTVSVPVHINVVPGDEAAGRIADPTVGSEVLYQRVQQAKRRASSKLTEGDADGALVEIRDAQEVVRSALAADPPPSLAADFSEEAQTLQYLADQTQQGMISRAAKYSSMDYSSKSSKRGRPIPPTNHPRKTDTAT
jgi:Ca-activated chloride channel family protein